MRFLADESCDFAVVRALRLAGHDVLAVTEVSAGSEDQVVIDFSVHESRILLTEDKDFDNWFMPADGPQRAFSSSDSQKRHERRFVGLGRKAISWLAGLSSCSPVEYASAQSQKVKEIIKGDKLKGTGLFSGRRIGI